MLYDSEVLLHLLHVYALLNKGTLRAFLRALHGFHWAVWLSAVLSKSLR